MMNQKSKLLYSFKLSNCIHRHFRILLLIQQIGSIDIIINNSIITGIWVVHGYRGYMVKIELKNG